MNNWEDNNSNPKGLMEKPETEEQSVPLSSSSASSGSSAPPVASPPPSSPLAPSLSAAPAASADDEAPNESENAEGGAADSLGEDDGEEAPAPQQKKRIEIDVKYVAIGVATLLVLLIIFLGFASWYLFNYQYGVKVGRIMQDERVGFNENIEEQDLENIEALFLKREENYEKASNIKIKEVFLED